MGIWVDVSLGRAEFRYMPPDYGDGISIPRQDSRYANTGVFPPVILRLAGQRV
jgi:hypothetical protein